MADEVRYRISVEPVEELTDEQSNTHQVISGEVARTLGGAGEAVVTDYSAVGTVQGFANGIISYLECVDDSDAGDISSETTASFVFIKNTGYTYSSATALGVALSASVKVMVGTTLICLLDAGECMVLKDDNKTIDCTGIHVRTVQTSGTTGDIGHLAVEYLVVDYN